MTRFLLIAAVLPGLARIHVPEERAAEWRKVGFDVVAASDLRGYEKVPAPNVEMRVDRASATSVPWIDANGWRFLRGTKKALYEGVPAGRSPLAAAEAFAYGVDAIIEPAQEDLPALTAMYTFLRGVDKPRLPVLANIAVIDDGSEEIGEVLNLLSRRNLLYKVVSAPDPSVDLSIRLGSPQYPKDAAADPNGFAARVREQLSDSKRLVRVYGSYTVLAHLTGDRDRARLHLLNYGRRPVRDLRVRLRGGFDQVRLADSTDSSQQAKDVVVQDGGTEVTVPLLQTYSIIDLERRH